MDTEQLSGIEKQFRESLQALSSSPQDQVRTTTPGDVPEEIVDDYLLWSESYLSHCAPGISSELREKIIGLANELDKLPDSAFRDTNIDSMIQPEWEAPRQEAKSILKQLNWPIEPPPEFHYEGFGVYKRQ